MTYISKILCGNMGVKISKTPGSTIIENLKMSDGFPFTDFTYSISKNTIARECLMFYWKLVQMRNNSSNKTMSEPSINGKLYNTVLNTICRAFTCLYGYNHMQCIIFLSGLILKI